MSSFPNEPTGFVRTAPEGRQLVLERTFRAPIGDVWASLTESDRFARWYGTLEGEAGPGKTITVAMTAEEEVVETPVRILACDPPNGFTVDLGDEGEAWHIDVRLTESDGVTTLVFVQTLTDAIDVADVGPGWEFYADRLTAALTDVEMPDWEADAYLDALAPHYRDQ